MHHELIVDNDELARRFGITIHPVRVSRTERARCVEVNVEYRIVQQPPHHEPIFYDPLDGSWFAMPYEIMDGFAWRLDLPPEPEHRRIARTLPRVDATRTEDV